MVKKDSIFKVGNFNDLTFTFNEEVTEVFEDMIDRSVPGYTSSLRLIENLSRKYFIEGTHCYDLGCSLGASSMSLIKAMGKREGKIFAIDNSPAMIAACEQEYADLIKTGKVKFIKQDVNEAQIDKASVVVINFVLQFLNSKDRDGLLKKVFLGMKQGALLILSEKIHFDNKFRNQTIDNLHHQFKSNNGYSKMEISRKRDALEGVLITDLETLHLKRLESIGFKKVRKVMTNLNFMTLVAEK
jgi:tRNA (cmo5U34)-methyltransferase|tara:strand:- start:1641 stop:2369 length:729 start_codon:yes stop_codon:yes gene_type:complete